MADPNPRPSHEAPERPPNHSPEEPHTVSGYLAVALLLAMFAYGVFHVMRAHHSPMPFRMGPVEDQLQALYEAAQEIFVLTDAEFVTITDLTQPVGRLPPIVSIYGEDYSSLRIERDDLSLIVQLPGSPHVTYTVTAPEQERLRAQLREKASAPVPP